MLPVGTGTGAGTGVGTGTVPAPVPVSGSGSGASGPGIFGGGDLQRGCVGAVLYSLNPCRSTVKLCRLGGGTTHLSYQYTWSCTFAVAPDDAAGHRACQLLRR